MQVKLEDIIQSIYFLPQEVLDDVLGNFKHLEYPKTISYLNRVNLASTFGL
jgi:hypothetical protein